MAPRRGRAGTTFFRCRDQRRWTLQAPFELIEADDRGFVQRRSPLRFATQTPGWRHFSRCATNGMSPPNGEHRRTLRLRRRSRNRRDSQLFIDHAIGGMATRISAYQSGKGWHHQAGGGSLQTVECSRPQDEDPYHPVELNPRASAGPPSAAVPAGALAHLARAINRSPGCVERRTLHRLSPDLTARRSVSAGSLRHQWEASLETGVRDARDMITTGLDHVRRRRL